MSQDSSELFKIEKKLKWALKLDIRVYQVYAKEYITKLYR